MSAPEARKDKRQKTKDKRRKIKVKKDGRKEE
jgi:hypothetical protein